MRRRSVSGLCRPFNSVLFFVFFFINDDPLRVSLRSGLRRTLWFARARVLRFGVWSVSGTSPARGLRCFVVLGFKEITLLSGVGSGLRRKTVYGLPASSACGQRTAKA